MIAIIDYGVGNVGSILNMLRHVGVSAIITKDQLEIENASKLILPGVGAFDEGMTRLNNSGLTKILNQKVIDKATPILGVCLGMQMMTRGSEEGSQPGLNWINAHCIKFQFNQIEENRNLRVPHMGWNDVEIKKDEINLFPKIDKELQFYFAHSFHLVCEESIILGTTKYGYEFPVAFKRDNILGVQFHPEKSHQFGMNFLKAFATSKELI